MKGTLKQLERDARSLGASQISNLRKLSPAHCRQLDRDVAPRVVDYGVI
jgi:hypothetical protein